MRKLDRHKLFIKDARNTKITDQQATKLFLYIAALLKRETLPKESKDHRLNGEWADFREFHIGGDMLIIYSLDDEFVYLARLGTHAQLFKRM